MDAATPSPAPTRARRRPARAGYRQRLRGELLGGVQVTPLQREPSQRPQVIHGEKVLADAAFQPGPQDMQLRLGQ